MFLSCDKPSRRIIDNKTSMTKEERIQKRWDNRIDSVSYAIGLDVAMRLDQQFDRFDYERINKAIKDYYTETKLELSDKERVNEIAEMLSGDKSNKSANELANELLN